jgi:hypothetical protein
MDCSAIRNMSVEVREKNYGGAKTSGLKEAVILCSRASLEILFIHFQGIF